MEKNISFNVNINVKLAGVTNKDGEKLCKNIHLRFMDSCRFIKPSLDKRASDLDADQSKKFTEFYTEDRVFKFMR